MNEMQILKTLAIMENFRMREEKAGKYSHNDKDFCMRLFQAILSENLPNHKGRAEWVDKLKSMNLVSYDVGMTAEDYNKKYNEITEETREARKK